MRLTSLVADKKNAIMMDLVKHMTEHASLVIGWAFFIFGLFPAAQRIETCNGALAKDATFQRVHSPRRS